MMHAAGAKRASTDKAMTRKGYEGEEGPTDTNLFPCIDSGVIEGDTWIAIFSRPEKQSIREHAH